MTLEGTCLVPLNSSPHAGRSLLLTSLSPPPSFPLVCLPSAACDHQGRTIDVYIPFATQGRETFPKPTQLSCKILGLLVTIPHVKHSVSLVAYEP